MQIVDIKREFRYNGIVLADPSPDLAPQAVAVFYAAQYPELLNAVTEGPVTKNGMSTYTFTRQAGAKGMPDATSSDSQVTAIGNAELAHLLDIQVRHFALATVIAGLRRNASVSTHEHLVAVLNGPTIGALLQD